LPSGISLRSIASRPKEEPEPGPLSVVERQIIKKFSGKPATVIARLLAKPVRVVRKQIKLIERKSARGRNGASRGIKPPNRAVETRW
jgi:hypothetical protein